MPKLIHVITGDAMFAQRDGGLNDKLDSYCENINVQGLYEIKNVQTTGFASRDRHKNDWVIVTITLVLIEK